MAASQNLKLVQSSTMIWIVLHPVNGSVRRVHTIVQTLTHAFVFV